MAQVTIDFSDVADFQALPKGDYPVMVESVELRQSQTSDNPYLNFSLRVTEGEYSNRVLFMINSLSAKSLWRLKETLRALGFEGDKVEITTDPDTNLVIEPELVGLAAIASVSQEPYEGRIQNRVQNLKPMTSGDVTPQPQQVVIQQPQITTKPVTPQQTTGKKPALNLK